MLSWILVYAAQMGNPAQLIEVVLLQISKIDQLVFASVPNAHTASKEHLEQLIMLE